MEEIEGRMGENEGWGGYYYYFTLCEFFTPVFTGGLSLESGW